MRRPPRTGSVRRQLVLLTTVGTAAAMLLLTLVLQLVLAELSHRDIDRLLEQRADAVVGSVSGASGETLVVPDLDLDAGIVVFDAAGEVAGGSTPPALRATYERLATAERTTTVAAGDDQRVLAHPFTTRSGVEGVVVVTERTTAYEEAQRYALLVSLVTGALVTAATAGTAAWVVGRALRPVRVLAETASHWSEHDLGQRFGLGPPTNELTTLAATLDTLLDRVAAALRSEQQLTAELAHELRTPLTSVQGTADLALLRDDLPASARADLQEISAAARRMSATISTLLDVARSGTPTDASSCRLAAVVRETVASGPASPEVEVHVDVADHRLALPEGVALRALGPVVENARRHARTRVSVTASATTAGSVTVTVEDDGDGVRGEPEHVFEPGSTAGAGSGAGLGLAIARRMARSVGGDVDLVRAGGPTTFAVRLPRA